jgi:hypothetical protein
MAPTSAVSGLFELWKPRSPKGFHEHLKAGLGEAFGSSLTMSLVFNPIQTAIQVTVQITVLFSLYMSCNQRPGDHAFFRNLIHRVDDLLDAIADPNFFSTSPADPHK